MSCYESNKGGKMSNSDRDCRGGRSDKCTFVLFSFLFRMIHVHHVIILMIVYHVIIILKIVFLMKLMVLIVVLLIIMVILQLHHVKYVVQNQLYQQKRIVRQVLQILQMKLKK